MDGNTANEWSGLAFRGLLATIFGIAAVFWPDLTLRTLVYLFGGFILASGLVSLVGSLSNVYNETASFLTRLIMVVLSVLEIGVGVYLLRHPGVAFKTLILLIGFILIARGAIEIMVGLFEVRGAMFKTVMIIGGLLAAVAGVVLLFQPVSAGVAFVWILGLYGLIAGPLTIALALDIKNNTPFAGGPPTRTRRA